MYQRAFSHHRAGDRYAHDGHREDRSLDHSARRHQVAAHEDRHHAEARPSRGERAMRQDDPPLAQSGFTFGHGGRQVRIGPVAFWICIGTLVIMAGWSAITATYFAFHDDVLARLIARQAAMQFAYEDRIADMRAQVDRVTSRQLLDQEQFEQRLGQLAKRQAALEARASSLGGLSDQSITGSIRPSAHGPQRPTGPPKPSPISSRAIPATPAEREAQFLSGGVTGAIARVQDSLDRIEADQTSSLNSLEQAYDGRIKRMRGLLAELGLAHAARASTELPAGGPYVPYRVAAGANPFERQIQRVMVARTQADRLTRTMASVPIRKPVVGELDMSSGFGVRLDPFLNKPAMHTGLDFRGNVGEPVRATASGTVSAAGWSGGYGRMVEIDHGNGLSTRYGHLSEIEAKVGQSVKIGQVIGRLGSTGRSTGPHLHYETRVDGEAVDPEKFLRAGMRVGAIL
jgi:murein DD-endopeptidase MepM/ murein hydrolase activator NlpD